MYPRNQNHNSSMVFLPVVLYFLLSFHILNASNENDVQNQNVTISLHSHNNSK